MARLKVGNRHFARTYDVSTEPSVSRTTNERLDRLMPHLKLVSLSLGEALYESGIVLPHVYFPTDSVVSLLSVMLDGASAEIAVVGNDGVVGISLFMGGETTPSRGVVQSAGQAYRLEGHY